MTLSEEDARMLARAMIEESKPRPRGFLRSLARLFALIVLGILCAIVAVLVGARVSL